MTEDEAKELGRTVRALRKRRGLTQSFVAQCVRVDQAYISLIEQGKRNVTISVLHDVCDVLGARLQIVEVAS